MTLRVGMAVKKGLTLGKYAPLHSGHQYVIETALAEMDHLTVVIYHAPEQTAIPLSVRAGWIRHLYPEVTVIEAADGPRMVGNSREIQKRHEHYLLHRLDDEEFTAFYSSEFYGEHVSRVFNADNRIVDQDRNKIPVSGTLIRKNPFTCKEYIHPYVYKDLITNVVFLGAPSTGKTTLARHLARYFQTEWMPEYGRTYWKEHQVNRRLSNHQLVEIAKEHLNREDRYLKRANTFLFTDTNALTTYIFGMYYHGHISAELAEIASSVKDRYDFVLLCDMDIVYEDSWDRSGDGNRIKIQKMIIKDLKRRKIPYICVSGNLEERIHFVKSLITEKDTQKLI